MSELAQEEKEAVKLVDPLPNFMPIWTEINSVLDEQDRSLTGEMFCKRLKVLSLERGVDFQNYNSCLVGEGRGFTGDNYKNVKDEAYCNACYYSAHWSNAGIALQTGGNAFINFKIKLRDHLVKDHGMKI